MPEGTEQVGQAEPWPGESSGPDIRQTCTQTLTSPLHPRVTRDKSLLSPVAGFSGCRGGVKCTPRGYGVSARKNLARCSGTGGKAGTPPSAVAPSPQSTSTSRAKPSIPLCPASGAALSSHRAQILHSASGMRSWVLTEENASVCPSFIFPA